MAQKKKKSPAKNQNTAHSVRKSGKTFPYELTIGIIVKDDVIRFQKLMESLQPLRDAISCQLIITDTGSTDGTREVAEKYADLLIDFQWIDDFSAARNTGVEKAEGRWFFAVDSDNEMDHTYPVLVDFLKSDISYQVEFVGLTMRHFTKKYGDRSEFTDTIHPILRSHQIQKHYYHDRIHEHIKVSDDMIFHNLPDLVVDHWGYAEDVKKTKTGRNTKLMLQMLEEDPTNIKQHIQLILETQDTLLKENRIEAAINIAEHNNVPHDSHMTLYIQQAQNALETFNWSQLEAAKKGLDKHPAKTPLIMELEMAGILFQATALQDKHQEVLDNFAPLLDLFQQHEKNPSLRLLGTFHFEYADRHKILASVIFAAQAAFALEKIEHGIQLLETHKPYSFQQPSGNHPLFLDTMKLFQKSGEFSLLTKLYATLVEDGYAHDVKLFHQCLETNSLFTPEERNRIHTTFPTKILDSYTAFCAFRQKNFAPEACTAEMKTAISQDPGFYLNPLFRDLLYGYVRSGADPLDFVERNDASRLVALIAPLFQDHDDLIDWVQSAYNDPSFTISSLKQEKIWAYLGMNGAHHMACQPNPDASAVESLFFEANHLMYDYTTKVYQPAMLSPVGVGLLPLEEYVSPYIARAKEEKSGNHQEYTALLKEIQKICPAYGKILEILSNKPYQEEFSALAEKVKTTILTLLTAGDKGQAKILLDKYKTIAPNDPDLLDMLRRCL